MATHLKNLSAYDKANMPDGANLRIGIAVSDWNGHITDKLLEGAVATFIENGVKEENIRIARVPGAFELPLASQWLMGDADGVLAIGVVIQGETRHFDFVCDGATQGIMDVMLKHNKPVSFCVLTDNNEQQSLDRAGGKHGNKGIECAAALLQMLGLQNSLSA